MRRAIFTTVIILVLSGMVSGYETSVSWIEGTSPPDFFRSPEYPTTNDLVYFTIPTSVYRNFLVAEQTLGGVPTITVNSTSRIIELYFQSPAPGGSSSTYNPVCGLEGYFGRLEAGTWLFYVHFSGTIYIDDIDVASAPITPIISGNIMSNNGRPISNVTVTFSSGGGSTTTNTDGDYAKSIPYNWSGTAMPSKTGYTFSPTFRAYGNVTTNITNQDYIGTSGPTTPIISGYITDNFGWAISDVIVTFSSGGGSTVTDTSGYYAKSVPYNWSGTAVPTKTGYTFNPSFRSYSNVTSNRTNQNYTGTGAPQAPEYFTELFSGGDDSFDLTYKSITFTPTSGDNFYSASVQDITQLPTDPTGGTSLIVGDDNFRAVQLTQASVSIYGNSFTSFYVGSNGFITFTSGDPGYSETLAHHFGTLRISALLTDLNPSAAGEVSVKQLSDRVAVTWENVQEFSSVNSNTFQIVMYFNGTLQISWLEIDAQQGIVGLSAGDGVPSDFEETDMSELSTAPPPPPPAAEYFTEQFSGGDDAFDLSYKSILFTPTDDDSSYSATLHEITQLPTDPSGGTNLGLGDDSYIFAQLDQASVIFYGSSFSGFYVGSNGYITFTQGDLDYSESLTDHFKTMRISSMFRDLNPASTGQVTAKQLSNRVAVTWENVAEYNTGNLNTFQIEMYFDGRIQVSWLSCATQYCIAGLSEGMGLPEDFEETDLSELSVGPTPPVTGYLTEQFTSGDDAFDLSYRSVMFTPASDGLSYSASVQDISQLPTDSTGGKALTLGDDSSIPVTLSSSATVSIYGSSFSSFYVGSNGYITFTEADIEYSDTLANHFDTMRISALFDDLNPSAAGQVSWKQLTDRVAVTWLNVPQYSSSAPNTFQIEMYFDGRIQISWLEIAAQSCIVGLSDGLGVPEDFEEIDFSELGIEPPPQITGYMTEYFSSSEDAFDLSYTSITFTPTSDKFTYSGNIEKISALPTDTSGGKALTLGDDASASVTLSSSATVSIYGNSFSTFYVGSNGYITFTEADSDYSESLADHFDTMRISALFADLNPSTSGQVRWKQLADRVAVTWQNVPQYGSTLPNTFQVVMYFDGRLQISWLDIAAQKGIVGLSDGLGVPEDFEETDLSEIGSETPPPVTGYSTEQFTSGDDAFDLSYTSVMFTPSSDETSYSAVVQNIAQLPTTPTGGKSLTLGDDASTSVTLSSSAAVSIFGDSFSTFYVGSNGYITFTESDRDYSESLVDHFDTLRISGLFVDLNPSASGQVSWKQLSDRVAVTWQNVPQYGTTNSNTFQIEMYLDGRIQIAWLAVAAPKGIVGLSDGLGVPEDFEETDFSEL
jgi:Ca2+-binding EF-hand superfamily protein